MNDIPFSDDELRIVHRAVADATRSMKAVKFKQDADFRGELYTKLRQSEFKTKLPNLFINPKRKYAIYNNRLKWDFIERLAKKMCEDNEETSQDSLNELRILLAGAQNSLDKAKSINNDGEKIIARIKEIDAMINPLHGA